jgi:O-antigen ligase
MPSPARRWAPALLLAAAPLIFVPGQYESTALPQSVYVRSIVLGAALAAWARASGIRLPPVMLPLGVFLAWSAASVLWAENKCETAGVLAGWGVAALVFLLAAQAAALERLLELMIALLGAGTAVASIGIAQYVWGFSWVPQVARPAATFSNKNLAAELVVLVFPLGLALLRRSRSGSLQGLCAAGLAVQALYLFYSFSRIAWIAAGLQIVLFGLYLARHRREISPFKATETLALSWAVFFVVAMVAVGPHRAATGEGVEDLWEGTLAGLDGQGWDAWMPDRPLDPRVRSRRSVSIRLAIWRNTAAMLRDAPVRGVGLGNHQVQYPAYAAAVVPDPAIGAFDIDHVHNEYLRIAAELGVVGVALFAWTGAAVVGLARRRLREASSDAARWPTLAFVLGLAGAAVLAFGGFPFDDALPPPVLMLYIGLLAAAEPASVVRVSNGARRLGLVLLAAAGAAAVYASVRQLAGGRHAFQMARAAERGDWTASAAEGEAAYRANPCRPKVLFGTGWAHLQRREPLEAARAFEVVVAAYPYHMNALGNLGLAYLQAGELERSEAAFERVIGIKPDDARTHYHLSQLRWRQGRWDEARSELRAWQRLSHRQPAPRPEPRLDPASAAP